MYSSTYSPPQYLITPQTVLSSQQYADPENGEWQENAIALDAALISAAPEIRTLADQILPDLIDAIEAAGSIKKTNTQKSRSRLKEAVKVILLNSYVSYLLGLPVRFSRNTHYYSKPRRYGKLFFKHGRILAAIDALEDKGYLHQKTGFFDHEKKFGRTSRMWASKKLIDLFQRFLLINFQIARPAVREEIIELRNAAKDPIAYDDTRSTNSARKKLRLYNDFINQTEVTIQLTGDTPITLTNLCKIILASALSGDITITNLTVNKYQVTNLTNNHHLSSQHLYTDTTQELYNTSMTHKFFSIDQTIRGLQHRKPYDFEPVVIASTATGNRENGSICLAILSLITKKHLFYNRIQKGSKETDRIELIKRRNAEKHNLAHFGIHQLEFTVNAKSLHRVFSEEKFSLGGRFYGAYHEKIPKEIRSNIKINGQSTIELDYSAHHIRMPYHLTGIDYQDDPYKILTKGPNERDIFKKLCLIAVNAENESKAIKGFRKAARGEGFGISLTDETIRPLLDRVKKEHQSIAKYIHSKKGLQFQNKDSQITEAILMSVKKQDIPCLPVHDSYIVPTQYEEQLLEAMITEYKKLMGFEPVIG